MSTSHETYDENTILKQLELDLDRLYGARYASLVHFRIYGQTAQASTYVARVDGVASSVLLFRRRRQRVTVLNEGIELSPVVAADFASTVFHHDPAAGALHFRFVDTAAATLPYPSQCVPCGEDTVLTLAQHPRQYLDSLGGSTRATLKHRLNKLRRDFPSFTLAVHEKQDVDETALRAIIGLNRLRMAGKDKVPTIDAVEEDNIVRFVRERGFVTVATINGAVCAGAICYRLGRNFAARSLAHDPQYDPYRLGFLCAYLSICECVAAEPGGQFNFGWGQYEYKYHLGGKKRLLHQLVIYRSRWHRLRHADLVLQLALTGWHYRARRWLDTAAQQERGAAGRLARAAKRAWHRLSHLLRAA